jgi:DnaD/phage-associated family protein
MNIEAIQIGKAHVHKLLSAASGDAALLYLYLQSGNAIQQAAAQLRIPESRIRCAMAILRQLELCPQEKATGFVPGERPAYTEQDVLGAMDRDPSFRRLYGEVQRRLGRTLTTEELKILLSFVNYLGLPEDVICVLVSYCQDRARQRGNLRNPALRTIEKEAYAWAEQGIDTIEAAAAFIHSQNVYHSRLAGLLRLLQIRGRNLTAAEEKYARQWLELDMEESLLALAYERTCLNTGGLNWAYMHKILLRWKQAGYRTVEDVKNGDRKPGSGAQGGSRQLDADEIAAIQRMLQED